MNQVLIALLLVSVFGYHGISSVLATSYGSRKFTNFTQQGDNKIVINIPKIESQAAQESSTEVPISSQKEDQDPSESSESIVYNKFEKPVNKERAAEEEEEEEPEGPPDHVIPHSDHEDARNVSTKPKYTAPGEWAKPPKEKEVQLDFVPSRVYAQVRKTHTLRRLPRRKAIENAESEEEKENAARLREVVKNSKVNTVYTEEGYEDAAYDHAGHIRDADFHEGYAKKLHDQIDQKEKLEEGNNEKFDEEEYESRRKNYKHVYPEEFKDFDEDYSDGYETDTEHGRIRNSVHGDKKWKKKVNPIVVAEDGIHKLQDDLEREDVEIEKGVEISKLESVEETTDRETQAESQVADDYDKTKDLRWRKARKRKGPYSSAANGDYNNDYREELEDFGNVRNLKNSSNSVDDGNVEVTTLRGTLGQDSSGLYRYRVHESVPNAELINSQRAEENPTTLSYSQLFWDYFKRQQNQLTATEAPLMLEPTTLNPHLLQGLPFVETVNDFVPISVYAQETTTDFPIVESSILNPPQIIPISEPLINPEQARNSLLNSQIVPLGIPSTNDDWQPINTNTAPTTQPIEYSDIHLNPQQILNTNEFLGQNPNNNFFYPSINTLNKKPRYKITMRHKLKSTGPSESSSQESATSSPVIEPLIENTTPIPVNENYMKVLMHLQNEKHAKNHYHPNSLQQSNFYPGSSKNRLEDLTQLRPPLPQKPSEYYYNLAPRIHPDALQSDWTPLPVHQRLQQIGYPPPRKHASHSDSLHAKQSLQVQPRLPRNRKRNTLPPFELIPLSGHLRNDLKRQKETMDYVNHVGNRSRPGRNILRPFRQTIGYEGVRSVRARTRERRSSRGQTVDDESIAKESVANNGASNRDEIENPSIKRNCTQKVTRVVEVGLDDLDTSRAKQAGEKKSRSCAMDRGEGSRAEERESIGINGEEGRNGGIGFGAVEYDDERQGGGNVTESERRERKIDSENNFREIVELSGLTGSKNNLTEGQGKNVALKRTKRNTPEVNLKVNDKLNRYNKLLNEAPKLAEDVIEKEIDSRFNENEEVEGKGDREKKVEVEVPEFDYVEEIIEQDQAEEDIVAPDVRLDLEKYPFYAKENLPMPSALKYAMDPARLPKKTYGQMEFYNSRDAYKHCDEVEPNLEVLPEKEEPEAEAGPKENVPRLRGLGDKLECFKAKYFDDDPFDNPLFYEKEVEDPEIPSALDTKQFASRLMMLPKENDDYVIQRSSKRPENYRQPRKPISIRFQKTRRIRYKNDPRKRTRTRPRKRPVYRVQVPQVKIAKVSKKPHNAAKNSATSASELSTFYLPYQNQVYEDVMGTIKNLANSYQGQEVTTTLSPEETTSFNEIEEDNNVNFPTNLTSFGKKEKNKVQIDIMEQPSDLDINIKGVPRHKNRNRYRPIYKRTRRPQRNKPRIQIMQTPIGASRTVKHRQRIRVYKRDLEDVDGSQEEKWSEVSDETDSSENVEQETEEHIDSEENQNHGTDFENDKNSQTSNTTISPAIKEATKLPEQKDTTTPSTNPMLAKRKAKILKRRTGASTTNLEQKKEKPGKVIYTIKDRIRYSKPKAEVRRVGKFGNDAKDEEDDRRREPKYNFIRKKNPPNAVSTTTDASLPNSPVAINSTETAATSEKIIAVASPDHKKENITFEYLGDETRNESTNGLVNPSGTKQVIDQPKEESTNKTVGGYAVYENVNEGEQPTTTQKPQSATPSEFFSLKSFLEINPPGYIDISSEDFKKSFFPISNSSDNYGLNFGSLNSNVSETEKTENLMKAFPPSYFSEEEASEKTEKKTKDETSTESSEESNAPSKENDSEEDRTFFAYASRPDSPAENYEDQKYSDLGPRVNKPAFVHPPFSLAKYRKSRSRASSEEIAESTEQKEEYVFPWHKDKDQRKRRRSRSRGKSAGEYEYPWERRERLAKEEKERKDEKRRRLGKSFDEEDEEAEESFVSKQKSIYPRGRYRYWSRKDKENSEDLDNTESSSETRPLMKYSSRYNSRNGNLPFNDKSAKVGSKNVEEISKSIQKALEGDSIEKEASSEDEDDSSWEKGRSFSYRPRSISKGIVPEDVTMASPRRSGKRGKLRSDNSGGKNNLDSSESEAAVVKAGTRGVRNSTESNPTAPVSKKRRRPSKNADSAVESTIVSDTEATRARRKQKSASTTPATIISTTSASRVIRRRNHKSPKEAKKNAKLPISKLQSKSSKDKVGLTKSGTVEQRSRRKKNRTNEIMNEATKNDEVRVHSGKSSRKKEPLENVDNDGESNAGNDIEDKKSVNYYTQKEKDTNDFKEAYPSGRSEERYDYKDDKMAMSDSDRSEGSYEGEDYDFGSEAEADTNFAPQNGELQVSEQGSKEVVTSGSWISENYDF